MATETHWLHRWLAGAGVAGLLLGAAVAGRGAAGAEAGFKKEIQPLLEKYCYDCHGDGMSKGQVAFDGFKSTGEMLGKHELWLAVLKNTRAGLMPPEKKARPTAEEQRRLEAWIKGEVFRLDAREPDPGRVTLRRLNREEYRNTIRDLMGHDFKVEEELPPDDTGYGFDNIGDVLTVSPMLLEKYMQAAESIVAAAVPRVGRVVAEKLVYHPESRGAEKRRPNGRFTVYEEAKVTRTFTAALAGSYRLVLELEVLGEFDFDPGQARVVLKVDDGKVWQKEYDWEPGTKFRHEIEQTWAAGERVLTLEIHPLVPVEKKTNSLDVRFLALQAQGPLEKEHWVRPRNFELFFTGDVPESAAARRDYAREVLRRFATRAFRRPVDEKSLERLVKIAEASYGEAGKRFEDGVAQAMIPVLASPRFLFRVEENELGGTGHWPVPPGDPPGGTAGASEKRTGPLTPKAAVVPIGGSPTGTGGSPVPPSRYPFLDEHALASRLSYFLWSTMPDEELFQLAKRGELRKNLAAQVKRMLADGRSRELTENFVGQWLQVRDIDGIDINARAVLARDGGMERGFNRDRRRFQELREIPEDKLTAEQKKEVEEFRARFRRRQRMPQIELDRDLRRAMRQESEMAFAHVVRENRSVVELLDADYTFLNEKLARHYGLTNLNVTGGEMRRVTLPKDSPRGGVLTQGAPLIVTSNPTRTSPVKRGLFVLDNILGLPPPPPPPDIPNLEDSEHEVEGRQPTLREVLAIHREKPLCASCHNRMDPLGLALENFNALGMWRDKERGQPIDAAGRLITGEEFKDIREVKRALTANHRLDFYRCLTEKLLTYALGRGLEYYDVETVDQIVERLDREQGRFGALLTGVIESAPFQKRRKTSAPEGAGLVPNPGEGR